MSTQSCPIMTLDGSSRLVLASSCPPQVRMALETRHRYSVSLWCCAYIDIPLSEHRWSRFATKQPYDPIERMISENALYGSHFFDLIIIWFSIFSVAFYRICSDKSGRDVGSAISCIECVSFSCGERTSAPQRCKPWVLLAYSCRNSEGSEWTSTVRRLEQRVHVCAYNMHHVGGYFHY